jgi:hypothetical protein
MKYLLILLLLIIGVNLNAQDNRELFRGGMSLHTGFVQNHLEKPPINGIVTGIGGKISFRLGNHFRLGTEGYVSTFGYNENEGQYKLGWGGILTEYQFNDNKLAPVLGVTLGGGKVHDLYVLTGNFTDNNSDETIYKVYTSFIVTPHFSLEYKLTDSINLVGKVDYIFYPGIDYPNFIAKGPRIYFGVLFMR